MGSYNRRAEARFFTKKVGCRFLWKFFCRGYIFAHICHTRPIKEKGG